MFTLIEMSAIHVSKRRWKFNKKIYKSIESLCSVNLIEIQMSTGGYQESIIHTAKHQKYPQHVKGED